MKKKRRSRKKKNTSFWGKGTWLLYNINQKELDDQVYYYRMYAVTSKGKMSYLTSIKKSRTASPPQPPNNIKANANTSRGVFLTWTPPSNDWDYVYIIERKKMVAS